MNITEKHRKAHRNISIYNEKFLDFVDQRPFALKNSNYEAVMKIRKSREVQPWPIFVDRKIKMELENAAMVVLNLIKSIPRRVFRMDAEKIGQYLNMSKEDVEECLEGLTDVHMDNLLTRGDFAYSQKTGFKIMEYNVDSILGGWNMPRWTNKCVQSPIVSQFINQNQITFTRYNNVEQLLKHIIDVAIDKNPGLKEHNLVGFHSGNTGKNEDANASDEGFLGVIYQNVLTRYYRGLKGSICFTNSNSIQYENNRLYFNNKPIHSLLQWSSDDKMPSHMQKAFAEGNVLLYNGNIRRILSNKLLLAVLYEMRDSDIFTPEEQANIKKYIPWSCKIVDGVTSVGNETVHLKQYMLRNKDKLVIKPGEGYGGQGVFIGPYSPEELWEETCNKAIQEGNWLLQEYIESDSYIFHSWDEKMVECHMVWGAFFLGKKYGGSFNRVLSKYAEQGIVNCKQGAAICVILEV